MRYKRMPIEIESPEQMGYDRIRNNLSESSYTDALLRDIGDLSTVLKDLVLCYGSHAGHEELRALIIKDAAVFAKEDVLLTTGAAAGLFIIATTLLEPGDELIVVRPNYATNLETPSHEELQSLAVLAKVNGIYLLVDETYRDMKYDEPLPLAATYGDNVISISSLSKTYGLPGLRIGWVICRDRRLMERFLAAKEQIHICGSPLDEEVAFRYMQQRERHFQRITCDIREKFGIVKTWMQGQDDLEWIEPEGGCVCFPRIKRPEQTDIGRFYKVLLEKYGTYTGAGHWFEMPQHYMRIGFGWPVADRLEEGLKGIAESLRISGRG